MKTPRLEDFDQTPKRPVRELFSPIDDMPRIEKPTREKQAPQRQGDDIAGSPGGDVAASPPHPEKTSAKGLLVRRGFDYYDYQLVALKKLSLREQLAGRDGSMSRMLREALDRYLADKTANPENSQIETALSRRATKSPLRRETRRAGRPGLYNPPAFCLYRSQQTRQPPCPLIGVCE